VINFQILNFSLPKKRYPLPLTTYVIYKEGEREWWNILSVQLERGFQLPAKEDGEKEFQRLKKIVKRQRDLGREIVVVMGVGFVGAVMAAVIADSKAKMEIQKICYWYAAAKFRSLLEDPIA